MDDLTAHVATTVRAVEAQDSASVELSVSALADRLLAVPPDVRLTLADIRGAAGLLPRMSAHSAAAAGVACCLTLAAWHLQEADEANTLAGTWMRLALAACELLDARGDAEQIQELAATALEIGALCDVLDAEPSTLLDLLVSAAASASQTPGCEVDALEWVVRGAHLAKAAALSADRWRVPLQSTSLTVHEAVRAGRRIDVRKGIALLMEAQQLLGLGKEAQTLRLQFLPMLVAEGLDQQAEQLATEAARSPWQAPGQDVVLELTRASLLMSQGHSAQAVASARSAAARVGGFPPTDGWILAILVSAAIAERDTEQVSRLLAPTVERSQRLSADQSPPDFARLMTCAGMAALEQGDLDRTSAIVDWLSCPGAVPVARLGATQLRVAQARAAGALLDAETMLSSALREWVQAALGAPDQIIAERAAVPAVSLACELAAVRAQTGGATGALEASEVGRGWLLRSARTGRAGRIVTPGRLALIDRFIDPATRPGTPMGRFREEILDRIRTSSARELVHAPPVPQRRIDELLEKSATTATEGWAWGSVAVTEHEVVVSVVDLTTGRAACSVAAMDTRVLVRATVETFTRLRGRGPEPRSGAWRTSAEQVLAQVFSAVSRPLLDALDRLGCGRVVLSAPGWLSSAPLLASRDGSTELIDHLEAFAVVPGLEAALELLGPTPRGPRQVFVGAAADDRIPLACIEARAVGSIWGDARAEVTADLKVGLGGLIEGLNKASISHLALHGTFDARSLVRTRLLLHESELDVTDVFDGLNCQADLVVLSACQTMASAFTATGEAFSMGSFMAMTGVRRVIGSLWNVSDEVACLLMVDLHQRLVAGGEAATSLLEAQRWIKTASSEEIGARAEALRAFATSEAEMQALDRLRAERSSTAPWSDFVHWSPIVFTGMPGRATASVEGGH